MRTPFSEANKAFSDAAHNAAQRLVYPHVFGVPPENLTFESTDLVDGERGRLLDGELAIDRIVKVTCLRFAHPFVFTVQERFRKVEFAKYRDITITEWNHNSGLPGELYKLTAGIFLYGYFDADRQKFPEAVAIATVPLLRALAAGQVQYSRRTNPRTGQSFLCLTFNDLEKAQVVLFRGVSAPQ